ncbi:polysaccharide/polyol phosphate ABC transporter ATP-binding protein [Rubrivivax gelatinosus]|nr:polysaccharide/polyol phosphate ABC transporter ATP-binding protein [Rubrivivax gelatinosus]
MAIIEVDRVCKEFRLGQLTSLGQTVRQAANRLLGRRVEQRAPFMALNDVSFSVEPGEVLGIIGHNGAGKSTMLKLLARIAQPTSGRIAVNGRVAPLIEVGAGLVGEMTGRENIFLNASILGMKRAEIRRKFDEIVDFSELEEFIDTPIKRYSSGMQIRLAFAIATTVDAEILIVDEVLAVGDLAFQRKCFDRMEDLIRRQQRTVILVSHNIRQVQRLCDRVIFLEHGQIEHVGEPKHVCDLFYARNDKRIAAGALQAARQVQSAGDVELVDTQFESPDAQRIDDLTYGQDCTLVLYFAVKSELRNVTIGFGFHTTDFLYLTTHNSEGQVSIPVLEPAVHRVRCKIRSLPLLPGVYAVRVGVTAGEAAGAVFYAENVKTFQVVGDVPVTVREGFFALAAQWDGPSVVEDGSTDMPRGAGKAMVQVAR